MRRPVAPRDQGRFDKLVVAGLPDEGGDAFGRQLGALMACHPGEDARAARLTSTSVTGEERVWRAPMA